MAVERRVKIVRAGEHRTVSIPAEFEFPGGEAGQHREGERLILEPVTRKASLLEFLSSLEPLDEDFPDIDEGLLPLREIQL